MRTFLSVSLLIGLLFFGIWKVMDTGPSPEERRAEEAERKAEETKKTDEALARIKLKAEIQRAPDFPCQSPLEFVYFSVLGWYVTCDGCSALPASKLYPKIFMNKVELYAIDGRISLPQFLRMTGECP